MSTTNVEAAEFVPKPRKEPERHILKIIEEIDKGSHESVCHCATVVIAHLLETGDAWRQKIPPLHVGVDPDNRDTW